MRAVMIRDDVSFKPKNNFCRVCDKTLKSIIDFGNMPIANEFQLPESQTGFRFRMVAAFCDSCALFQLMDQPKPELMFHDHYAFFATTSNYMKLHFKSLVEDHILASDQLKNETFVVEIGSNDGILLASLKNAGIRHLGVDASENVVEHARSLALESQVGFFGEALAKSIKLEKGSANFIIAANVICHIPDLLDLGRGIVELLHPLGEFIFEEPYAMDVLRLTSYDQFYDEHIYIFSLTSVSRVFSKVGLELTDAIPQNTHGGSMRYVLSHRGTRKPSERLMKLMESEESNAIGNLDTYNNFAKNCFSKREELHTLLQKLREEGKRVGGYAATSKSTTILNFCEIGSDLIEFISDSTPEKIGTFTPATKIPVISHEDMRKNPPEYLVLFAWNHAREILTSEYALTKNGMKWILFVPEIRILDDLDIQVLIE